MNRRTPMLTRTSTRFPYPTLCRSSWAVPKGIPATTARNNLAVQTEDHPMEYATFSGAIPAGQYGAGTMTIWDEGRYELEKWRDDEVIFTLEGRPGGRSEEHTSELQSLMSISYAAFCLKKKKK